MDPVGIHGTKLPNFLPEGLLSSFPNNSVKGWKSLERIDGSMGPMGPMDRGSPTDATGVFPQEI